MNTLLKSLTAVATLAVLAGCSSAALSGVAPGTGSVSAATQAVDMTANLRITGEGGYRVQALTAWNLADIDHVKLTLTKNGTAIATKSIARAALSQPVTLNNLKMATSYKIIAQAFADAAEANAIDNTAEAGSDAANSVTFTTPSLVTNANGDNIDDAARTVVIPVRLKNKNFAGQASSNAGVAVTNGTIVNTGNAESF